jgi:hypothetical protein
MNYIFEGNIGVYTEDPAMTDRLREIADSLKEIDVATMRTDGGIVYGMRQIYINAKTLLRAAGHL